MGDCCMGHSVLLSSPRGRPESRAVGLTEIEACSVHLSRFERIGLLRRSDSFAEGERRKEKREKRKEKREKRK